MNLRDQATDFIAPHERPSDVIKLRDASIIAGVHSDTIRNWARYGLLSLYMVAPNRYGVSRAELRKLIEPRKIEVAA